MGVDSPFPKEERLPAPRGYPGVGERLNQPQYGAGEGSEVV